MKQESLDPDDWESIRALGHRVMDDMIDFLAGVRDRPVWAPIPEDKKETYREPLPLSPTPVEEVYTQFREDILPYTTGNIHPRFFAWVQGTGTFTGALADFMASIMNPNVAIGEHSPMYVDGQVVDWCKEMLGFPKAAGGLLVSGATMANLTALAVAREPFRDKALDGPLVAYASTETHACVTKAIQVLGLGKEGLCSVPVDGHYRIRTDLLRERIRADRAEGKIPFCIVANAGTVNTGAIDPLGALWEIAREENLWLHIDGAFGALAKLIPAFADELAVIERADSVAFDLHKWLYMPYEVGCVLIRDAGLQRRAFATKANYLLSHDRGLAAGPETISNKGIELSRGFKALKVWMSLKEHGIDKYRSLIAANIAQAKYLGERIREHPELELLAGVSLNIVCYRYNPGTGQGTDALNALNKELLMRLHGSGKAAPSYTLLDGRYAIRAAITNHRTRMEDMDVLVEATLEIGRELTP